MKSEMHEDERRANGEPTRQELLPFDVEHERFPMWAHAAAAGVVVLGGLVAAGVVPMLALLPFFVAASLGRRFSSASLHVEVDAEGLLLGQRRLERGAILDVWRDARAEGTNEARVIVASDSGRGVELAILDFENPVQARRFADALAPAESSPTTVVRFVVAGHWPRPVDALPTLRFAAIAAAFIATGSWMGAFVAAYGLLGAWGLVRAKQIVVRNDAFDLHTLFGTRTVPASAIANVELDTGVIRLKDGSELVVAPDAIRDTTLAAPSWREAARSRVLERIATLAPGARVPERTEPEGTPPSKRDL